MNSILAQAMTLGWMDSLGYTERRSFQIPKRGNSPASRQQRNQKKARRQNRK